MLLPSPDAASLDPEVLTRLGLKVAHPDAAHGLLEKLGALPATPRAVLTTPQVRAAVAASLEDDGGTNWEEDTLDADELADTVLGLVRDAGLDAGDEPWLGALALPDEDGELSPAGELVFPGGPFAQVMREDELAAVDAELAEKWGRSPWPPAGYSSPSRSSGPPTSCSTRTNWSPARATSPNRTTRACWTPWTCGARTSSTASPDSPVPPVATEIVAVRDLDLVDDDRWPEALALLSQPPLRDALVQSVRVLLPDGTHEVVRPYTAWWLRRHPVLGGRRPAGLRAAGGDPLLRGLYDEADATGFEDEQVLRALGVRTSVAALLDEPGGAAGFWTASPTPTARSRPPNCTPCTARWRSWTRSRSPCRTRCGPWSTAGWRWWTPPTRWSSTHRTCCPSRRACRCCRYARLGPPGWRSCSRCGG